MLDKVREQSYVTFVGASGSGKTATARHIALNLQKEGGYEILPIMEIKDIVNYSDSSNPQVYVLDDMLGVYAFDMTFFHTICKYEKKLKNPVMPRTKVLMTCRETLIRNEILSNTFLCDPKNVVFLHSKEHLLTDKDKFALFKSYKLDEGLLTTDTLKSSSNMFPYLCKMFSSTEAFKSYWPDFFISPVPYILKELEREKVENRLNYASLVLLMAYQNKLSKEILNGENNSGTSISKEMRNELLEKCKVEPNTSSFQFLDSLSDMEVTYTTKCENEYSFIHDSMFEIIAHSFGSKCPELMIQIMSSDYVTNYIKAGKNDRTTNEDERLTDDQQSHKTETIIDLSIVLSEAHQFDLLAKRFFKDLGDGKFYNVFGNKALKHPSVIQAFINEMGAKSYPELNSIFLSELTEDSKMFGLEYIFKNICAQDKFYLTYMFWNSLLNIEFTERTKCQRGISWVVYFGHHQILQWIIDKIQNEKGTVDALFQNSYNAPVRPSSDIDQSGTSITEMRGALELVTLEQCRLLCLGCYSGDLTTVQILLQHVQEEAINNRTSNHRYSKWFDTMPLSIACDLGGFSINNNFLEAEKNVKCKNGLRYIFDKLIKAKIYINERSLLLVTPLTIAINCGHLTIVRELINKNADINVKDINGYSVMGTACRKGNLDIVKELLNKQADSIQTIDSEFQTGDSKILPVPVEYVEKIKVVYVNPKVSKRVSPFIVACFMGHLAIVEELIRHGIDVNKDDYFVTPLAAACSGGHPSVIKLLLSKGANKTEISNVEYIGHTGVVLKLIGLEIDLRKTQLISVSKIDLQTTSFISACAQGQLELAEKMIKKGADVNLKDGVKTPLIVACYFGHLEIVNRLIRANVETDLGNGFITPLQVACYKGQLDIVSELIKGGAAVNLKYEEVTALAVACHFGHVNVVEKLMNSNVDVNEKSFGETPIEIALNNKYYNVGKQLKKAGADVTLEHDILLCCT